MIKFRKGDYYTNANGGEVTILSVEGDIVTYKTLGGCFKSPKFFTKRMLDLNKYIKEKEGDDNNVEENKEVV